MGGLLSLQVRDSSSEEGTFESRPERTSFEKVWERERGRQVPVHRPGKKAGAKGVPARRWEMRAEATRRGLVLAKVRSLAFIRNAVGEARGFKVGFHLVLEITEQDPRGEQAAGAGRGHHASPVCSARRKRPEQGLLQTFAEWLSEAADGKGIGCN